MYCPVKIFWIWFQLFQLGRIGFALSCYSNTLIVYFGLQTWSKSYIFCENSHVVTTLLWNSSWMLACLTVIEFDVQGPHGELSQAAPCLRDIDLSSNLLSDWEQVLQLSVELQHLTVINVSSNKIFLPKNISSSRATGLRKLILNNCGLSDWQVSLFLIHSCKAECRCWAPILDDYLSDLWFNNFQVSTWKPSNGWARAWRLFQFVRNSCW